MRALWALAACAAVLALGGCGGGGDNASTATSDSSTAAAPATVQDSASVPASGKSAGGQKVPQAQKPNEDSTTRQDGSSPAAPVKPPPVSSAPLAGAKAPAPGVKTVKGADDSVQTYGVESTSSERTEAAIALQAYLGARLREDWASACEALAQRPRAEMEKLAKSASAQGKDLGGCAGAMAALGEGSPQPPGTTVTEVLSLRGGGDISGDPSYLIFSGPPGQTLYSMPVYFEDGGWKMGLAIPAELPL